jgi:hypothetical protein
MPNKNFSLSVEEVALVLSMMDRPNEAHNLMITQLGDMDQDEARARLLAAGNSMLARNWLILDQDGTMHLSEDVVPVAYILSDADFSIRYNRSHSNMDVSLSFHFREESIFAHGIEQGVVHHLREVENANDAIQGGESFFKLDQASPFTCSNSEVPYNLLEQIKDEEDFSSILKPLEKFGVPEETRTLLAEDLHEVQYRGSVLRVEYGEDNVPKSDEGLLVLRGPERLWLLRPFDRDGERYVTLLPGTEEVFRQEVSAIL